jgi:hypothetical protein
MTYPGKISNFETESIAGVRFAGMANVIRGTPSNPV